MMEMMELTKEQLITLSNRENVGAICSDEIVAMARQLLAGMEQEPVAYIGKTMLEDIAGGERHCGRVWAGNEDRLSGESRIPLYAAPQLPQPAVLLVPDERSAFETFMEKRFKDCIDRRLARNGDGEYFAWDMQVAWITWQGRAAILQGADGTLTNEDTKRVGELVMWVKRLAHSLRKANPDSKLQSDAMDYLSRGGLIGVEDILR